MQAEVSGRRVPYEGPAVTGAGALEVRYGPVNCADAGFERELYLDNIGMARRTVTTIAGPRTYELAGARVGKWSFAAAPGAAVRLTLDPPSVVRASEADPIRFEAELRISLFGMEPLRLRYPTSQRYDLVLRDDGRRVAYRWSDGRMFLQAVQEEEVAGERAYTIQAETPGGLPDGAYQVEVWLTTDENPRFAASGAITVETAR
jgi:hypothetical protein